jgi:hypothetical protein
MTKDENDARLVKIPLHEITREQEFQMVNRSAGGGSWVERVEDTLLEAGIEPGTVSECMGDIEAIIDGLTIQGQIEGVRAFLWALPVLPETVALRRVFLPTVESLRDAEEADGVSKSALDRFEKRLRKAIQNHEVGQPNAISER